MARTSVRSATSPLHGDLLAAYDGALGPLRAFGEGLCARVTAWLAEDSDLKLHSVTMRLKDRASLATKLARPDRTYDDLWDVTDLLGLRVITYFEDGVDRVGELLEARLPIDVHHSVDKRRHHDDGRFGYRSLHYVCRAGPADEGLLPRALRFEIQVRTVLEHAWAEIEHDLGYKAVDTIPASTRRRLNRIAGLLELADQEFVAIRRELSDYAHALPARIASAADVPLDRLSLAALLECAELVGLDQAIASQLGRPLGEQPFFPDYLVRMLRASGLTTVTAARAALVRQHDAILALVAPYFAFTTEAWRLSPERLGQVSRGYALLFLAHVRVIGDGPGDDGAVTRLAQLYQELDYPDDPATAEGVARGILRALAQARTLNDPSG